MVRKLGNGTDTLCFVEMMCTSSPGGLGEINENNEQFSSIK